MQKLLRLCCVLNVGKFAGLFKSQEGPSSSPKDWCSIVTQEPRIPSSPARPGKGLGFFDTASLCNMETASHKPQILISYPVIWKRCADPRVQNPSSGGTNQYADRLDVVSPTTFRYSVAFLMRYRCTGCSSSAKMSTCFACAASSTAVSPACSSPGRHFPDPVAERRYRA